MTVAGNAAILRTSEYSPKTHVAVADLLIEAGQPSKLLHGSHAYCQADESPSGLPEGVLNVVHVTTQDMPEVTEALIARPEVRKLNFSMSLSLI